MKASTVDTVIEGCKGVEGTISIVKYTYTQTEMHKSQNYNNDGNPYVA